MSQGGFSQRISSLNLSKGVMMTVHERMLIKANQRLIRLHVEREDARLLGLEDRGLTSLMLKEKTRISELKGQLIRQQPKESSWMTA